MTDHTEDLEPLAPLAWPPPPAWPTTPPLAVPPPEPVNPALFGPPPPEPPPPKKSHRRLITGVIVAMLIAGLAGFGITNWLQSGDDFNQATGNTAPVSSDPDARSLGDIVIRQRDVTADNAVALIPNGDQTQGTTTLDLCNGSFPSELLRTARLQVAELDGTLTVIMSTEAVLYHNSAATEQAFRELRSVRASCPTTPVPSKSGFGAATTTFHAAPDGAWANVRGVERQAYDFESVNEQGDASHSISVYLRRGRALLALYFSRLPDPQPAVARNTTVESITALFEKRLAAMPDAVVNRP